MVHCRCDRPLLDHEHLVGVYQQVHRFGTGGSHFYYMVAGEVIRTPLSLYQSILLNRRRCALELPFPCCEPGRT